MFDIKAKRHGRDQTRPGKKAIPGIPEGHGHKILDYFSTISYNTAEVTVDKV